MAAFDLTAADPLMKIHFNPRIVKQFNTAAVLFNRYFEGKGTPISNRGLEIPIHTDPNADFLWYSDGGTMPGGSGQGVNRSVVGFVSFCLAVQFTGAALDAAGDDSVTYARALTFNIKNATIDAIKYLNIYSFLDGTGMLAKINTNATLSTTTTTNLDVSGTSDGSRFLRKGMTIDVQNGVTSTLRTNCGGLVINLIVNSTTIQVQAAAAAGTPQVGDAVIVTGSWAKVISGLQVIIDNATLATTFQNVNRSTVPAFNGNVIALSGTPPLARDYLRRSLALIQIARGAVDPGMMEIWSHPAQLHQYADMGWSLMRFADVKSKKLDLGYTAYEWEGVPWVVDTDCPKDHIFWLDRESMLKVTARNLSFDDRTGAILRQLPSATAGRYDDKFVAYLIARFNLGTYAANCNTKVNGLGIPSGY